MLTKFLQQIPGFFLNIHLNKNGELSFPYLDDKFVARQNGYYMSQQQCSEFMLSLIEPEELNRLRIEMQSCIAEQCRLVTTLSLQFPGKDKVYFELFGSFEQLSDLSSIWYVYANEMTDLISLTKGLHSDEEKIKKTLNQLPDAILTVSKAGLIKSCNTAVLNLFGYPKELLTDQSVFSLFASGSSICQQQLGQLSVSLSNQGQEVLCKTRQGKTFPAELRVLPVSCASEQDLLMIIRDLSEQKASEAMVRQFYYYDQLTMIPGRVELEKRLQEALEHGQTQQLFSALVLIDIVGFRELNQLYTTETGDKLLVLIAKRLSKELRVQDCVCRFGGDEFVLIFNGLQQELKQSEQLLELYLQQIQHSLDAEFQLEQQSYQMQFHYTTFVFDCNSTTTAALLRQLDLAAYQARLFQTPVPTSQLL